MSCVALPLLSGRVKLASDSKGGGLCVPSVQNDWVKVLQVSKGKRILRCYEHEIHGRRSRSIITSAVPVETISAAAAIMMVTGSCGALIWLNQDKWKDVAAEKPKCEACNGSGLCSSCNGEGFQLKNLSSEAAARARARARDAATRYTAGLAKKWSYCTNCSGSRNCPECSGSGSVNMTQTRI